MYHKFQRREQRSRIAVPVGDQSILRRIRHHDSRLSEPAFGIRQGLGLGIVGKAQQRLPQRVARRRREAEPELLRGGRFTITVRSGASLVFPVTGRDSRAVQSLIIATASVGYRPRSQASTVSWCGAQADQMPRT